MNLGRFSRVAGVLGTAAALSLLPEAAAFAQDAAAAASPIPPATVDKADTGFMFLSTIVVLLMTVPGLALFYGGLTLALLWNMIKSMT